MLDTKPDYSSDVRADIIQLEEDMNKINDSISNLTDNQKELNQLMQERIDFDGEIRINLDKIIGINDLEFYVNKGEVVSVRDTDDELISVALCESGDVAIGGGEGIEYGEEG